MGHRKKFIYKALLYSSLIPPKQSTIFIQWEVGIEKAFCRCSGCTVWVDEAVQRASAPFYGSVYGCLRKLDQVHAEYRLNPDPLGGNTCKNP